MPELLTPEQRSEVEMLAAVALGWSRRSAWEKCGETVCEISDRFGAEGMQILVLGLADTMILQQFGKFPPPGARVAPLWVDEGGPSIDADNVSPAFRWVGRFVAARAARDWETCCALVNSCSDDEFTANVCMLLDVVATTINAIHGEPEGDTPE